MKDEPPITPLSVPCISFLYLFRFYRTFYLWLKSCCTKIFGINIAKWPPMNRWTGNLLVNYRELFETSGLKLQCLTIGKAGIRFIGSLQFTEKMENDLLVFEDWISDRHEVLIYIFVRPPVKWKWTSVFMKRLMSLMSKSFL